ncbi:putative H(+)-transporting two-sector ATPase [Helianthus annuus]|nr:putative H(+)-transporting two-sector ATPase [Helianthus annuus]KAJ0673985.1 putative H(+)-transporting two-sector ATPase [Helianthus annuus]
MASTAAVPFWRSAGMTYITYSNICANLVRNCLKDPYKSEAISREKVHFSVTKWADGKPQKPSNFFSPFLHSFSFVDCLGLARVCFLRAKIVDSICLIMRSMSLFYFRFYWIIRIRRNELFPKYPYLYL